MKTLLFTLLFCLFTPLVSAQTVKDYDALFLHKDDIVLGNNSAPVTIVTYSDFQCPYCNRARKTVDKLRAKYGQDLRVVFRHFRLPFHKQAKPAAKAAEAARKQDAFIKMHDILFENQKKFSKVADIDSYLQGLARQLGLDEAKFIKDYGSKNTLKKIEKDFSSATRLGVHGTPHFFINGLRLTGAQSSFVFEKVIDAQLIAAQKVAGKNSKQRYENLVQKNYTIKAPPKVKSKNAKPVVTLIPIEKNDPKWGSKKRALVTMVQFSDYQCPFCKKADLTITGLKKKYGKKLRIIYKQLPLAFHQQARKAARAALAANHQKKFKKMHSLLFKHQKEFREINMDTLMMKLAKKAHLNMGRFETDYHSDNTKNAIREDEELAKKVGAKGTPNFFINGIKLTGAQPIDRFKTIIDKQITLAKKLKKRKKLSGNKLYRALVKANKNEYKNDNAKEEIKAPKPAEILGAKKIMKALSRLKKPFWKGKKRAKVLMYIVSDFQCPFCKRASKILDTIYDEYKDRVKFIFVNNYLPFHRRAEIAHLAAIAAGRQGKFWQMHDKIFSREGKITQDMLDAFAKELGLKMKRFERDRKSKRTKKQLAKEMAVAKEIGVRGTPSFMINGKKIVGAQPAEKFRVALDRALE